MKGLPTGDGGTVMLAGGSMKLSGQVGMQAAKLQQEMHSNEGHAGLHLQIITPYIYIHIYIYI
jgi:hypothetical protein